MNPHLALSIIASLFAEQLALAALRLMLRPTPLQPKVAIKTEQTNPVETPDIAGTVIARLNPKKHRWANRQAQS